MKDTSENWKNTWNNSFQTLDNRAAQTGISEMETHTVIL